MNSQDLINLQEAYLNIAENVSTGAGKRASRGGIAQRPSAREIEEIKAAAKRKPEPIPEEKPRQKRKGIGILPSSGVGSRDKVLRGGYARTPHGIAQRRATELEKKGRTEWRNLSNEQLSSMAERERRIRAALKKSKKWGTPEAAAEEVILGYLIDEGIADCLGSAEIILENMSDEWFDTILEAKWGEQPAPIDKMKKREEYYSKPGKMFKSWQDLDKPERIRKVREKMSR